MPTHLTKKNGEVRFRQCSHVRYFQFPFPRLGDTLWCPDCKYERTVISAPPAYVIQCTKCPIGGTRHVNQHLDNAIEKARAHVKSRPSHKIKIKNGTESVYFVERWDEGPMTTGESLRTVAESIQAIGRLDN